VARFLQFQNVIGKTVWINPDCVVGVTQSHIDEHTVAIVGADSENPWFVPGTVAEVLEKLQGDPQPEPQAAKAGDDIAGWWIGPSGTVYYIIGRDYWGRWVYQVDGHHNLNTLTMSRMAEWTRDPNRKGWEG